MTTQITATMILINAMATDPFVLSNYDNYQHNGLSCDDIGHKMALERSSNLEIPLTRKINEMPGDNTLVYSYKHPTGELTIFTVKCWD
jgi:hypothetical protein|tara:strand:+ start:39 stop:302 length:264 start_codon:yes stop_codon:yes gene_type:complete